MSPDRERELRELLAAAEGLRETARAEGESSGAVTELEEVLAGLQASHCAPEQEAMNSEFRETVVSRLRDACLSKTQPQTEPWRLNGHAARGWMSGALGQSYSRGIEGWPVWIGGLGLAVAAMLVVYFVSQSGSPPVWTEPVVGEGPRELQPTPDVAKPGLKPGGAPQVNVQRVPAPAGKKEPIRTSADEPWKQETYVAQRIDVGLFTVVMGEPRVRRIGKPDMVHALPGQSLVAGVEIETGDVDKAEIRLNEGSVVRMSFNAKVAFDYFAEGFSPYETMPRPPRIRQLRGKVEYVVAAQRSDNLFAVVTPVATAEALGTEFGLNVREKSKEGATTKNAAFQTTLTVWSGRVRFFNGIGKVEAGAMTESVAEGDRRPSAPKRLPSVSSFELPGGRDFFVAATSRLEIERAIWRLVFTLGQAGLSVRDVKSENGTQETYVVRVQRGFPAEVAGLQVGDIITSLDSKPVSAAAQVAAAIATRPGERISLAFLRKGEPLSGAFTIDGLPNEGEQQFLPASARARLDRATRPAILGDREAAKRALLMLLRDGQSAAALNNLGVLYQMEDKMGEAIRCFSKAGRIAPRVALYRFNLAHALEDIGNLGRSVEELEACAALAPKWLKGRLSLTNAYLRSHRFESALRSAEMVIRMNPESPSGWRYKSEVLRYLNRLPEALEAAKRAVELEPSWTHAQRDLASIYDLLRRYAEARDHAAKAVQLDPNDAHSHFTLGNILLDANEREQAEMEYRRAVELDGENAIWHYSLGQVLHLLGKNDEAEEHLLKSIKLDPRPMPQRYIQLGHVYRASGRRALAEEMFRKVIEAGPSSYGEYFGVGTGFQELGQPDVAQELFQKAIELDPKQAEAYVGMGNTYRVRNLLDQAEAHYRRAIEVDPNYYEGHHYMGFLYSLRLEFDKAEPLYLKAVALNPKSHPSFYNLGRLYADLKKWDQAEEMYRKCIELQPKNSWGYNGMATLTFGLKRFDEALSWGQKLLELAKTPIELGNGYGLIGGVELELGQLDDAEASIKRALENDASIPNRWFNLGRVFEAKGRVMEAIAAYRKTLELAPNHESAKEGLKRLGGSSWPPAFPCSR